MKNGKIRNDEPLAELATFQKTNQRSSEHAAPAQSVKINTQILSFIWSLSIRKLYSHQKARNEVKRGNEWMNGGSRDI